MKLERLIERGESLHQELGREWYLTGAGLKEQPAFQSIYDRYQDLSSDEALEVARESGSLELLEWILDLRIGRRTAPLEEAQLTWEQGTTIRAADRNVPYLRAPIELANAPDRTLRLALDAARVEAAVAGLNPIRRDRFALEREEVDRLNLGDYVQARSTLTGIDLDGLGRAAGEFLARTADAYRETLGQVTQRRLGVPVDQLIRADAAWAFRVSDYDRAFSPDAMVALATRQHRELGIDPEQRGRIRFDTEERPAKQPRAFCAPVKVPHEVYLVIRPRGGHQDYRAFWHEHGHALHFASADPELPFAARWLGDNSVTEAFAMLWDHMTVNRAWLRRFPGLPESEARSLGFELAVNELYMVRRYAAKLQYELVLHRNGDRGMDEEYSSRLTRATLFRYPPGDYLVDVDPAFYAARYLRAWQLQAALGASLTDRFDEDWFRNPRAGTFLQHLMSRGQADHADQLAEQVTGGKLGFEPLARQLEAALS